MSVDVSPDAAKYRVASGTSAGSVIVYDMETGAVTSSFNEATGHAMPSAPRGAVGGVALAWLRLFLQGDESARSQLAVRPDIACGFESSGVAVPLAMDR